MGGQLALEESLAEDFHISFDGVHLTLGRREVFRGLSCGCQRGKITVVLGGSGAGKSTMLRLIGGLERPDTGSVRVAGDEVNLLPERQLFRVRERIGMLFQGGALLDSMSVFDNVALPLREHTRLSEDEIRERVGRNLASVGLPDVAELFPRHLSGGMSRRAALARCVVMNPEIVLCDEPFSGLDPLNVRRIEALLVDLSRRAGLTLVVTSHHLASSLRMADRIVFLVDGRAVSGAPAELLNNPDHRIVDFLAAESQAEFDASRLGDEPEARPASGRGAA
jgi:phospholipid/cholesterol/gamma-HCH transport system ATP-binding protein